jgi:hypothetical protein
MPKDFPEEYFAVFAYTYPHIGRIDRHRPWTDPACTSILERVQSKYLTLGLGSGSRQSQIGAVKRQVNTIMRSISSSSSTAIIRILTIRKPERRTIMRVKVLMVCSGLKSK